MIASLTEREREVLQLVATGTRNSDIAEQLFIAEATAKRHIRHLLDKLDAVDRVAM